jgi:hypothetical protein
MMAKTDVQRLASKYGVDTNVVSLATLKKAIEIELEHKNLIGDSAEKALLIALAHLRETPRYYQLLSRMEKKEEQYWKSREKPSIFIQQ